MQRTLFYVVVSIFCLTALVTLLALIGVLQVEKQYLNKLFYTLIVGLISAVIVKFKEIDVTRKGNKNFPTNRIGKAYGFEYEHLILDDYLELDGSCKSIVDAKIVCTQGELKTREHEINTYCDSEITEPTIEFESSSEHPTRKIDYKITKSEKNVLHLKINFSPALKVGESATYKITTKAKDLYKMTYEDVLDGIKNGTHVSTEPTECHGLITSTPVKILTVKMNLPEVFAYSEKDFYDVFPGTTYQRSESEFQILKKNESFKLKKNSTYSTLELIVCKPIVGLTYVVKWTPPLKEKYLNSIN